MYKEFEGDYFDHTKEVEYTPRTISYEDVDKLIKIAVENKRDLQITINADGLVEINFSIPSKYSTSMEPDV